MTLPFSFSTLDDPVQIFGKLCIVTNSDNVRSAKQVAASYDDRIEICDRKALLKLLKTYKVTSGDVMRAEQERFRDKRHLKEALLRHKDMMK